MSRDYKSPRDGGQTPRFSKPESSLRASKSVSESLMTYRQNEESLPDPKSPYNAITHKVRQFIPQDLACKMGCKGAKCKYDNSDWPREKMAIKGLFSHWVTEDILAMARPRDSLIKNHDFVHRLKKQEIQSIFNLQTRNEHKDCGEGIIPETGYSYDPNDLTSAGIYYYNFELEDYGIADMYKMLDMVKVFSFSLTQGKVAVHCHAGLGRTGLLIACYLVYSERMTAKEAIHFVRENRPGAVQMNEQIEQIKNFEEFIQPFRVIFPRLASNDDDTPQKPTSPYEMTFSLHKFLFRQKYFLHGFERKELKYIPKVLYVCGERLKRLSFDWQTDGIDQEHLNEINRFLNEFANDIINFAKNKVKKENGVNYNQGNKDKYDELTPNIAIAKALCANEYSKKVQRRTQYYKNAINDTNTGYDELKTEEDPFVLANLIWSWLDCLKEPVLRNQEINILFCTKEENESSSDSASWRSLEKETYQTIKYLVTIISDLMPLQHELESALIEKLIFALTHTQSDDILSGNDKNYELTSSKKKFNRKEYKVLRKLFANLIDKQYAKKIENEKKEKEKAHENKSKKSNHHLTVPKLVYDYEEVVDDDIDTERYEQPRRSSRSNRPY